MSFYRGFQTRIRIAGILYFCVNYNPDYNNQQTYNYNDYFVLSPVLHHHDPP